MKRKDLEKLPFVSVRGRVYVDLDAVVAALEAEAKADAEPAEKPPAEAKGPAREAKA